MKVIREMSIDEFEFWQGAIYRFEKIKAENKLEKLEELLEEMYPNGIGEYELNELLWFDYEWIYDKLGIEDE